MLRFSGWLHLSNAVFSSRRSVAAALEAPRCCTAGSKVIAGGMFAHTFGNFQRNRLFQTQSGVFLGVMSLCLIHYV